MTTYYSVNTPTDVIIKNTELEKQVTELTRRVDELLRDYHAHQKDRDHLLYQIEQLERQCKSLQNQSTADGINALWPLWTPVTPKRRNIVYFIQESFTRHIKIGITKQRPSLRINEMRTGNSSNLTYVAYLDSSNYWVIPETIITHSAFKGNWLVTVEDRLHQRYSDYRLRGEWFQLNEELVYLIEQIRTVNAAKDR